jgi:DNA-binding PadR family transcriptional regulator
MQDKIILGFLAFRDLSLYDLRKAMEKSTAFFYNASTGSIHPALKKLETAGHVTVRVEHQGKRERKIYSRTDKGTDAFTNWIKEPLKLSTIKDEAVLRLFFLGQQAGNVEQQIEDYCQELEAQLTAMTELMHHFSRQKFPEDFEHTIWFQLKTLEFGVEYLTFNLNWMKNTRDEYRSKWSN